MDNQDLVKVCESTHGTAISEQLEAVLSGEGMDDQNNNALSLIAKFLRKYAKKYDNEEWSDLADEIDRYLKEP